MWWRLRDAWQNYMEGYHIRDVHPTLHRTVHANDYRVFVGKRGRFAVHKVPMKNDTPFEGGASHAKQHVDENRKALITRHRQNGSGCILL